MCWFIFTQTIQELYLLLQQHGGMCNSGSIPRILFYATSASGSIWSVIMQSVQYDPRSKPRRNILQLIFYIPQFTNTLDMSHK